MTSANIKDVSVSNIPQSNSYNSPKSKEDTREKFFSLMSDSVKSQMAVNSVSGAKTADLSGVSKGVGKVDFARGAAEAGTADTGKKMDKVAARDLIREYAEAVKKEIKDKSNTSEEELTLVMEELGLTLADLKNPNDLAMLFSRLEGGLDTIELLVDPGFKGLMDDITDLTRELTLGLDMSLEEMEKLIDEEPFFGEAFDISFGESENEGILIEDIRENVNIRQEIPTENNETAPKEPEEAEAGIAEALNSKLQKDDFENNKNNPQTGEDSNTFAKTEVNMTHRGEDSLPMDNRGFAQTLEGIKQEPKIPVYSNINPADIINQIITQAKTSITAQVRSMELQLNPENLGKMIMRVSENEGQITARFYTANEAVKSALEGAIASLIEKLNEQGIKVDAVSVSVSAHEFEENLEKNFMGNQDKGFDNGENDSQGGKSGSKGNINLRDDSYMEDTVLNEEEALTVSMMKTYGNTVNFRA